MRFSSFTAGLIVLAAASVGAQAPPPATGSGTPPADSTITLATDLKGQFSVIKTNLTKLAEAMPADQYAFRPAPDTRTFGEAVGHAAATNFSMCRNVLQKAPPSDPATVAKLASKAELTKALADSFQFCGGYLEALTPATLAETYDMTRVGPDGTRTPGKASRTGLFARLTAHNNEMYGYLAVYLRLKGIVPPSSVSRTPPAEKK